MRDPHTVMSAILEASRQELIASDPGNDFCSITVQPGAQPIYDFGAESCGGMLWVRLNSANLSRSFPESDMTVNNCAYTMAYLAEVGVIRPAPMVENAGMNQLEMPNDAEQFNASRAQLQDMQAMLNGLKSIGARMDDFIIQIYNPIGPEGGVVGGYWTFVFGEE